MCMTRRIYSMLVLLLVGSASLIAQDTTDPFPDVDPHKYDNSMIIRGQVRQNGVALGSDAVVAVYCGDEIRGKGQPFSDENHIHTNFIQFPARRRQRRRKRLGDGHRSGGEQHPAVAQSRLLILRCRCQRRRLGHGDRHRRHRRHHLRAQQQRECPEMGGYD